MIKNNKQIDNDKTFNYALYLSPPKKPTLKESNDLNVENLLKLGLNRETSIEMDKSRISKISDLRCLLSNDLVKKLEECSPNKSILSGKKISNLNDCFENEGNFNFAEEISPIGRDNLIFKFNSKPCFELTSCVNDENNDNNECPLFLRTKNNKNNYNKKKDYQ